MKMDSKEVIKKRLNKFKNPIVLILILGFVIRLYYYFMTKSQALWWDEAVYVIMARNWTHGLYYQFTAARPLLFSAVISIFNFISTSEFLPKMFILTFSMLAILGMYYLGRSMTDKRSVGLLSAFLTAIFYIHIFYTQRLLVDTLSFTFFIWSAYFFFKYFKKDNPKYFYIGSAIVAVGFLFRITTALILLVVLIYTIIIHGTKMFKKKEYYIGALIFLVIITPYILWGYFQFDGFVLTQAFETNAPTNFWAGGWSVLIGYIARFLLLLPNNWALPTGLLFIVGIIMMHECIVGLDMMRKGDKKLQRDFFLLLMFIIPLVAISFLLNHVEDRYIFNVFPAIFILVSIATVYIQELLNKKWGSYVSSVFMVLIIATMLISQFQVTDLTIKSKIPSYSQVKEAGLWIGQNSGPNDIIITHSYPQVQYYSWRYSRHFPKTEEEFEQLDHTNFTYFMVSIFERSPEWAYQYPAKKNLTVANAWLNIEGQQFVVVYNSR